MEWLMKLTAFLLMALGAVVGATTNMAAGVGLVIGGVALAALAGSIYGSKA